jgi:hypothetical protein
MKNTYDGLVGESDGCMSYLVKVISHNLSHDQGQHKRQTKLHVRSSLNQDERQGQSHSDHATQVCSCANE